jgi:hypothetical protein
MKKKVFCLCQQEAFKTADSLIAAFTNGRLGNQVKLDYKGWTIGIGLLGLDFWSWTNVVKLLELDYKSVIFGIGLLGLGYWIWAIRVGLLELDS